MSHSLIAADRQTHFRIVAVACVSAISLLAVAGSVSRTETRVSMPYAMTNPPVLKAGKPIVSATVDAPVIR